MARARDEISDAAILIVILLALIYFGMKRQKEAMAKCTGKGTSVEKCWELLR